MAHRHATDAVDHLVTLLDLVSIPMTLKVMNATLRLVVTVKIPEVDDMLEQAQEKVEAIRKAKEKMQGSRLIDKVIFAQNCPSYNPEWRHVKEGKATAYLASLVCRYMDKCMRKDKQLVLSAWALETIYHTLSSSVGKLISGKHYLGGYALDQMRDKSEKDGKELAMRRKHKNCNKKYNWTVDKCHGTLNKKGCKGMKVISEKIHKKLHKKAMGSDWVSKNYKK